MSLDYAPTKIADAPARLDGGLSVQGVTVAYRNGHTALRDASFVAPEGSITALVGVNGSGKSTLFKTIMGFLRAAAGEVMILGMPVEDAIRQNLVAYVPQAEEVDWTFTVLVEDVVMMGRYGQMGFLRRPKAADRAAVDAALARVDMTAYRHRQIGELSGGQKKRVFLARALAQDGQVILLDEPFTGVDVRTEEAIIALLRDLRDEGRVMLVSTHNLGSVPEFCDRTVLIKGTVLAYGPTKDVFTQSNLERAFGGVLRHFVLGGADLHDDEDARQVTVISDDERPFVLYDDKPEGDARPAPPNSPTDASVDATINATADPAADPDRR
ncbi:MAG: manganese/iron ABC transporter ATP-binding protein [Pseudomonadota bacterium]